MLHQLLFRSKNQPPQKSSPIPTWALGAAALLGGCSPNQSVTLAEPPQSKETTASAEAPPAKEAPTNRLAKETSPYLLLHAHNPVNWFPWGPEALAKARDENKVIFLSVGYSSCHWCHVMEQESFSDAEIAKLLNQHFVCIKVDREERPDIDAVYMKSVQIFSQLRGGPPSGGWPMSVFMTPQGEPFFGGTYFPARDGDRGGHMGFLTLVQRIQELWQTRRSDLEKDAQTLTRLVKNELSTRPPLDNSLDRSLFERALLSLQERFDPVFGGFGFDESNPLRPKFPEPSNLLFLIHQLKSGDISDSRRELTEKMLVTTLERMEMGGIRDHLGGGFHRYSVDRFWRIPHFEKMLYDNGQLASVYSEAYQLTGREDFRRVVDELLEFVTRELTDKEGGFYSALDADSEHEEGKFYRWEKAAVESLLSDSEYELFSRIYGLDGEPNFEDEFYALQLNKPLAKLASANDETEAELEERLAPLRAKLLADRSRRERPLTDTKILTSWNGLMIRGFADAGRILKDQRYVAAAERAADFGLSKLTGPDGRLLRTYAAGSAKLNAYLDDYAFFVDGLIALYRATDDKKWLTAAGRLTEKQLELFWDKERGGFFFTSSDHESLIARGRDPVDGAEPSGNSVSAQNLAFLGRELGRQELVDQAGLTVRSVSGLLVASPAAAPRVVIAFAEWLELQPEQQSTEE